MGTGISAPFPLLGLDTDGEASLGSLSWPSLSVI
jgi:hypothetical protein